MEEARTETTSAYTALDTQFSGDVEKNSPDDAVKVIISSQSSPSLPREFFVGVCVTECCRLLMHSSQVSTIDTHPTLFSRLQALLPLSSSSNNTPHTPEPAPLIPPPTPRNKSLKIRIVSWNMHDSLPSGDLEQLLGEIPPYNPTPFDGTHRFPDLGNEDAHPYHLVVV